LHRIDHLRHLDNVIVKLCAFPLFPLDSDFDDDCRL
jgi:hypothetical protein